MPIEFKQYIDYKKFIRLINKTSYLSEYKNVYTLPHSLIMDSCIFKMVSPGIYTGLSDFVFTVNTSDLTIQNSFFESSGVFSFLKNTEENATLSLEILNDKISDILHFKYVDANIYLYNNKIKTSTVEIQNSDVGVFISNNNVESNLTLNTNNNYISIKNYKEDNRLFPEYENGIIQKNLVISSTSDTIRDLDLINNGRSKSHYVFSNDTFISYSDILVRSIDFSKTCLELNHCHFSSGVYFKIDGIDTLIFENGKIDSTVHFDIQESKKPLIVLFRRLESPSASLANLDFDFKENMILKSYVNDGSNLNSQFYKLLLEKFKREGKDNSYKWVDIKYKKSQYEENGSWGRAASFIDYIWWDYGYDRMRIIIWTIRFLGIFFFINLLITKSLFDFYPVFQERFKRITTLQSFLNTIVLTFVMTLYIFFSFKIDFEKLKTKQTVLVVYFFTQYFIGLICFFFLFNAILKVQ